MKSDDSASGEPDVHNPLFFDALNHTDPTNAALLARLDEVQADRYLIPARDVYQFAYLEFGFVVDSSPEDVHSAHSASSSIAEIGVSHFSLNLT